MSALLFLISCIIFAVSAFGGDIGDVRMVPLGLAFLAGGHIVGGGFSWPGRGD